MGAGDDQMTWMSHDLLRDANVGVAIVDRDLRFVMINRVLASQNGLTPEEHIGRRVQEVVPHVAAVLVPALQRVLDGDGAVGPVDVAGGARGDSAAVRHQWNLFTPIRRDGAIVAVGAIVVDRTAEVAAEDALRKREAQFRALCDASPTGIFLTDVRGSSLYSNAENLRQMGLTAEEARGDGWQRAIHPDDLPHVRERFYAAMREGGIYDSVDRYLHRDGTIVDVNVKARAIRDEGEILGFVGMVEDVTERQETELRFRQLAESIDSVFFLSDWKRILYVSPAFERIWGRPATELFVNRMLLLETVHPDDREQLRAAMSATEPTEFEYRVIRPDGSMRWVAGRAFPVQDRTHGFRKAGVLEDVTARKLLEAHVREVQKLDSIGRLAGGIAHDFNNLLGVILGQVRLASSALREGGDAAAQLVEIEEAASRAAELTRQLLTFARRQPTEPVPLDPNDVVTRVHKLLGRVIGESIRLVVELDPDVGVVRADRTQLEQVLVNLAVNARDAMPGGGTLTIGTGNAIVDDHEYVRLRVSDTGHGIDERERAHVFEPFFTTKRSGDGTGLGLATCYGIVKQHGGIIDVDSKPGEGATFTVYLPRIDHEARNEPAARAGAE